ncbi:hypothetical protein OK349_11740 [Sphingomonas sp. BT-65]|uniref:hypothetical protein n=1 Tax=Sphingomonas sp. BT-65 TaxID=2989821 RepID=UPI002236810B|nr:hypothetical protein [Sphingomonas sp. BT-65]MCW4462380.1 hypothetical protein [Sphingomonas sp. BT-65]
MRYYLDAEFNGFGGPLIALALAPEDGSAPFYAALPCPDPTPWVAAHVLPVLGTEPIARAAFGQAMTAYLAGDPDPVLIADWPEDIAHAAMALIARPGYRHPIARITFELCDAPGFDAAVTSAVPHNALEDAIALREFMLTRGC